ncbi:alpha/beta fold hydrolase [Amnibacterium kyonggiense]|uniref:Pimeloyl-ACP methyl ester carboxylesterase n=1 Tax=Amnibacterium kyonggiense TaxID=595671 RepID=A0A4R7FLA8_9MICO|nr:alpha/beta hydrolase [Amnibacterium kyonggiense]TDS77191.1 pimeloyl-ACP methyl ester carboxylesterase [Amnibacterium kyonggiense]
MDGEVTGAPAVRDRRVPVDGGSLAVAEYGDPDGPPVLAIHGISASSRSWLAVARLLPDVRLIAPDLRGRGRSTGFTDRLGLAQHRDDMRAVLDVLGLDRVVVVGHSMGGFVALPLAAAEPQRVASIVLVDGGLPLAPPPGVDLEDLLALSPEALLGPAWRRLTTVFPSREAAAGFWRAHPAFADAWTDDVAAYADYDLEPVDGGFRPSADPEAVAVNQKELFGPPWYRDALHRVRQPVAVLRAPLGLQAEPPGLYPPDALEGFVADVPQLEVVEVPDVNHYTVLMTRPGADRVAEAVRAALDHR